MQNISFNLGIMQKTEIVVFGIAKRLKETILESETEANRIHYIEMEIVAFLGLP